MFKTTYTKKEVQWLHDNYYYMDYEELAINFELEFNRVVDGKALRRKCYNDGLRKQSIGINTSHYKVNDERIRNRGNRNEWSSETKFNAICKRIGLTNALLKGYSPL